MSKLLNAYIGLFLTKIQPNRKKVVLKVILALNPIYTGPQVNSSIGCNSYIVYGSERLQDEGEATNKTYSF